MVSAPKVSRTSARTVPWRGPVLEIGHNVVDVLAYLLMLPFDAGMDDLVAVEEIHLLSDMSTIRHPFATISHEQHPRPRNRIGSPIGPFDGRFIASSHLTQACQFTCSCACQFDVSAQQDTSLLSSSRACAVPLQPWVFECRRCVHFHVAAFAAAARARAASGDQWRII